MAREGGDLTGCVNAIVNPTTTMEMCHDMFFNWADHPRGKDKDKDKYTTLHLEMCQHF